jgi:hypothetical protein
MRKGAAGCGLVADGYQPASKPALLLRFTVIPALPFTAGVDGNVGPISLL